MSQFKTFVLPSESDVASEGALNALLVGLYWREGSKTGMDGGRACGYHGRVGAWRRVADRHRRKQGAVQVLQGGCGVAVGAAWGHAA